MAGLRLSVCRLAGLLILLIGLSITFTDAASAGSGYLVEPRLECVQDNGNGTYTAHFGYQNNTTGAVKKEVGESNMFSPGPISRGQPAEFLRGRQYGAFKVVFDGSELTWRLNIQKPPLPTDVVPTPNPEEPAGYVLKVTGEMAADYPCKIIPISECVVRQYTYDNNSGYYSLIAYYGYYNPFEQAVEIPIGENNIVASNYAYSFKFGDQEQTQVFQPGRVYGAFNVTEDMPYNYWNGYYGFYWNLTDPNGFSSSAVSNWDSTRECYVYPKAECIRDGCNVPGERGDRTAVFGYENQEKFTVHHRVHDNYNELYPRNGCEWNNNNGSGYDRDGNVCNYPQPSKFEPGIHENVFSACFDSTNTYYDEGSVAQLRWRLSENWNENYYNHTVSLGSSSKYCNRQPGCDASVSYNANCAGQITHLFLNGHLTKDPDNTALAYNWKTDCKQATLTGESTLNPILTFLNQGNSLAQQCSVTLEVKEQEGADRFVKTCSAPVNFSACDLDALLGIKNLGCSSADLVQPISTLVSDVKLMRRFAEHWAKVAQEKLGVRGLSVSKFMLAIERLTQENLSAAFSLPTVALSDCSGNSTCKTSSHATAKSLLLKNSSRISALVGNLGRKLSKAGFTEDNKRISKSLKVLAIKRARLLGQIPDSSQTCG